jgi:hypothetical protein
VQVIRINHRALSFNRLGRRQNVPTGPSSGLTQVSRRYNHQSLNCQVKLISITF